MGLPIATGDFTLKKLFRVLLFPGFSSYEMFSILHVHNSMFTILIFTVELMLGGLSAIRLLFGLSIYVKHELGTGPAFFQGIVFIFNLIFWCNLSLFPSPLKSVANVLTTGDNSISERSLPIGFRYHLEDNRSRASWGIGPRELSVLIKELKRNDLKTGRFLRKINLLGCDHACLCHACLCHACLGSWEPRGKREAVEVGPTEDMIRADHRAQRPFSPLVLGKPSALYREILMIYYFLAWGKKGTLSH